MNLELNLKPYTLTTKAYLLQSFIREPREPLTNL